VKESPYQVGDLVAVVWGEGCRVGVTGKESVFQVKFLDKPEGILVPAGGSYPMNSLNCLILSLESFSVSVGSPDGSAVPVKLVEQDDGSVEISYTPKTEGQHLISIFRKNGCLGFRFMICIFDFFV
jgi:hypothetical protein